MNHEDYVSFEQAKTLKKLGFDWECYCAFDKVYRKPDPEGWELRCYHTPQNHNLASYSCSAPTLAQAQKWLREVKGMLILIQHNKNFYWTISTIDSDDEVIAIYEYETYEKALLGAINKALEIIKNK